MKKLQTLLLVVTVLLFSSCTGYLDNYLNVNDYKKVEKYILKDNSLKKMKKKYILDNISLVVAEPAFATKTFQEVIDTLKVSYDNIESQILINIENNKKLNNFYSIINVYGYGADKYEGTISMALKINNKFDKEILYTIIEYKYVNEYNSEKFSESIKLVDSDSLPFNNGDTALYSFKQKYNDAAEFLFKNAPVKSEKTMKSLISDLDRKIKYSEYGSIKRSNLKLDKARLNLVTFLQFSTINLLKDEYNKDEINNSEFMLKGLQIHTIGVMFKDKTTIAIGEEEWEYLEL